MSPSATAQVFHSVASTSFGEGAVVVRGLHDPSAEGRVTQRVALFGVVEMGDLCVDGMEHQRVVAALETHEQSDRSARHLRDDRNPGRPRIVELAEHRSPDFGMLVGLVEVHADRSPRAARQLVHPGPLGAGHVGVIGGELEHAVTHGLGDAEELVGVGMCTRHECTGLRSV